jgi:DNA-binding winged helix-turn-helix (wHTH) protein
MPDRVVRFGEFTLDFGCFQLFCRDSAVKLEGRPLQLLMLLVERAGHLVTREEIADALWGRDVFVDVEQGINTAVRKVRIALDDRGDPPIYLQTVVGRGYRFVRRDLLEVGARASLDIPETFTAEELGQAIRSAAGLAPKPSNQKTGAPALAGLTFKF